MRFYDPIQSFKRKVRYLRCPVCEGTGWVLYKVTLDRHPSWFLKSRMISIEGPWGTCSDCRNHFSLREREPRLLSRAGGLPVEHEALIQAKRIYMSGDYPNSASEHD